LGDQSQEEAEMANPIREGAAGQWGKALALALAMAVVGGSPAFSQVAGGTIQGTIADVSGAVIPDVQVAIKSAATGVVTKVATNGDGFYAAPNLVPGKYEISAQAAGFSTAIAKDVAVTVGAQLQVNLTLKAGAVAESVLVTAAAPAVELASSTMRNVVDSMTVEELPLNGRDWTQLATLETGVAAIHTQVGLTTGPDRGNRGFGSQLTISGGRPEQNNYRLDGVSINDYSNGAPGSVLGSNLGVDAVEEFSVLTSNYSAEYGRTSGGVINAVTKSGTDSFHGTGYEFLRNSALDAKNYFDPLIKPPFRRNQFGASGGGPLVKEKTFIFADYEGVRESTGISQPITVPSLADLSGPIDPKVRPFLKFFPLSTDPNNPNTFTTVVNQVINEDYFTVRLDHKLSSADNLVATYVYDNAAETQPDSLNVVLTGNSTKRHIATAEDTHTFSPTVLNTVRLGFSRVAAFSGQQVSAINPLATDTSLGAVPGRSAPGIVIGGGIVSFPGGLGASPNYRFNWNSFQLYDDAFITKGIHFIKVGFATEHIQDNILASSDANGVVRFNSLSDFLANRPHEFDAAFPGSIRERQIRQHLYGGYIQDDIRLKPNFTVNAGLRYEMTTVPTDVHGLLSTLINPATDAQPHTGDPFFSNPTLHNFEPRVGFAWDPFKSGRTSLRGGFGMFDVLPLPYLYELLVPLSSPFYQLGAGSSLTPGSFPDGLFPQIAAPNQLRQAYIEPKPKRNYVMQWNINVQREIVKDVTGMIAYVGSRAVHQAFRSDDINTTVPSNPNSLTPTFPGVDSNGNPLGTLMNPNAGQISAVTFGGDAHYNALQAKLTARVGQKFQAQASYTWGKSIDTGSATVGGDTFLNSISSLPIFNPALRRGLSDYNVTHNLVVSYNWVLPSPQQGALRSILGGWQVGGVAQFSSGTPFTPNIAGDPLGLASTDPWDFPDRVAGCNDLVNPGNVQAYINTSCFAAPTPYNRRGNLGRNALIGPPLKNLDFSLFKNIPVKRLSETFNIQVRVEIFNILNHPNFAPPINHASIFQQDGNDPTLIDRLTTCPAKPPATSCDGAGMLDTTTTTSRQIQFGLKVIW
jgi:hypothetical protein